MLKSQKNKQGQKLFKSQKLSKSRKSKSEKLAKYKKFSKSEKSPHFDAIKAKPSFLNLHAKTVFICLQLVFFKTTTP